MKFLAHYIYIAPKGTYPEDEERPVESLTFISGDINKRCDFIADNFDGLDTFREKFQPEIIDWFNESSKDYFGDGYFGDDWSAGQWFHVVAITEGVTTKL